MTDSKSELVEALQRFENASMPDVIVFSLQWPTFATYLDALRQLSRRRRDFAHNDDIEDEISKSWRIARLLQTSLISPGDSSVGLDGIDSWPPPIAGELGQLQAGVRHAGQQLLGTTHPGLRAIQEMFARRDGIRWPAEGIVRVIVPKPAIEGTQAALASLELPKSIEWEVCNFSEAKQKRTCAVTLLPGSPEISVDWRVSPQLRSRMVSWLFNAPMSKHVILLRWPGSVEFEPSNYEPGPHSQVLDPRLGGERRLEGSSFIDEDFVIPLSSPPRRQVELGGEPVDSMDFQLPDNHWISFGIEYGPSALRIDEDSEFETDIETRLKAKDLRRGNTLVILESTAGRSLRRKICYEWISEHNAGFTAEEAQRAIDSYKTAIRATNSRELVATLVRRGLPEHYARSQVQRAQDLSTIAPERQQNLETIANAVGFDLPARMWDFVRGLRGGYMHAGRVIKDQLKAVVTQDSSWQDTVASRGLARLEVPDLGVIWLAPILAISGDLVPRHIGELGELVKV